MLLASIGAIQKESKAEVREKLIDIVAGDVESLVEAVGGGGIC